MAWIGRRRGGVGRTFRFFVHIGTEKTGTTTLQETLLRSAKRLAKVGVGYLHGEGMANARDLAAACLGEPRRDDHLASRGIVDTDGLAAFRERVFGAYRRALARQGRRVRTVVLSSEHLHSRLREPADIAVLRRFLEPHAASITLVCYLRPQVDLFTSYYSTYVRTGGDMPMSELAERLLRTGNPYFDYERLLSAWSEGFAGVADFEVRSYQRPDATRLDIVGDFGGMLGVSPEVWLRAPYPVNASIDAVGQRLLRAVHADGVVCPGDPDHARLVALVEAAFRGPGEQLTPAEVRCYREVFRESNRRVEERWGRGALRLDGDAIESDAAMAKPATDEPAMDEARIDAVAQTAELVARAQGPGDRSPRLHGLLVALGAELAARGDARGAARLEHLAREVVRGPS